MSQAPSSAPAADPPSARQRPEKARLFHPLTGANPGTLLRVFQQSGLPRPGRLPHAALALGGAVGRLPFSLAEQAYVAARSRRTDETASPVFILGHWRSGTTHLYNTFGKSPHYGYVSPLATALPWDFLLLGRLLSPLLERMLPEQRFIDRIPVRPDSPQEDEAAMANMQPVSFYHGLYFPRKLAEHVARGVFLDHCSDREVRRWEQAFVYFVRKLTLQQPGRTLVIKNPVYTARVAQLRRLFPQARFIHIHRDPLRIFLSMRNFYRKLLGQFALQTPPVEEQVDELILSTYARMMDRLIEDTADLPPSQFVELRYDQLDEQPLEAMQTIFEHLQLDAWEQSRPHFEQYLASVQSYRKNQYPISPEVVEMVSRRWGPYLDRWGYPRTGEIGG